MEHSRGGLGFDVVLSTVFVIFVSLRWLQSLVVAMTEQVAEEAFFFFLSETEKSGQVGAEVPVMSVALYPSDVTSSQYAPLPQGTISWRLSL